MPAKTSTTENADLVASAQKVASLLATAGTIWREANGPTLVIGDGREVALLQKLAMQVGQLALHEAEAVLGETVNYE
jgi:hypothetical protein